jgi:hypothetical protein
LKGKDLVVNFFQKKFERLKYFDIKDSYQVVNEKFVENRGAERNQARLNVPMCAAYMYITNGKNEV